MILHRKADDSSEIENNDNKPLKGATDIDDPWATFDDFLEKGSDMFKSSADEGGQNNGGGGGPHK